MLSRLSARRIIRLLMLSLTWTLDSRPTDRVVMLSDIDETVM